MKKNRKYYISNIVLIILELKNVYNAKLNISCHLFLWIQILKKSKLVYMACINRIEYIYCWIGLTWLILPYTFRLPFWLQCFLFPSIHVHVEFLIITFLSSHILRPSPSNIFSIILSFQNETLFQWIECYPYRILWGRRMLFVKM